MNTSLTSGSLPDDHRFTMGLLMDVFEVLEKHGYVRPVDNPKAMADSLCDVRALVQSFEGLTVQL